MLELVKSLNNEFNFDINDVVPYQFELPAAPYVAKKDVVLDFDFLIKKEKRARTKV